MPLDPTYPVIPVLSFLGFVLALIPLPWMLQTWNVGACSFSVWAALQCLNEFINTVVWRDSTQNFAPGFCDIATRFQIAAVPAIPACSLAINRRLFQITRHRRIVMTRKMKYLQIAGDLAICVLFPLLYIIVYYVVQNHRYQISEQAGCEIAVENSTLTVIILYLVPLIPAVTSVGYTALIVATFFRSRKEMQEFYKTNSSVSRSHYWRLLALSSFDALITLPTYAVFLAIVLEESKDASSSGSITMFWPGWHAVHEHLNEIEVLPASIWRKSKFLVVTTYYGWYLNVVFCISFFLFFGTTKEMIAKYSRLYWCCVKPLGFEPKTSVNPKLTTIQFGTEPSARRNQEGTGESGLTTSELFASFVERGDDQEKDVKDLEMQDVSPTVGHDERDSVFDKSDKFVKEKASKLSSNSAASSSGEAG